MELPHRQRQPRRRPGRPDELGEIAPAGNLPFESPLNITGPTIDLSKVLQVNYNSSVPKAIVDNGYQIQAQFNNTGADTINLGGQTFSLTNFHYHDTAENQVNGYTYPMEEHFVNTSASGATTVLAVFLQLGAHNSSLVAVSRLRGDGVPARSTARPGRIFEPAGGPDGLSEGHPCLVRRLGPSLRVDRIASG